MVAIKYRTKKVRLVLLILFVVGVLMLAVGGFMLSSYSSSTVAVAPEPTAKEALPTQAAFQITELVINPTEVNPGEEVTISAKVTNTSDTEDSHTVELRINNIVDMVKEVTIPAGGTKTLSFFGFKEIPGTYRVTLGELTGQFVVVKPVELTQSQCGSQCGCTSNSEITVPEPTVPSCCR